MSVEGGGEESRAVVVEGEAGDSLGVVAHAVQLLEPAHHVPHLDAVPTCIGRGKGLVRLERCGVWAEDVDEEMYLRRGGWRHRGGVGTTRQAPHG